MHVDEIPARNRAVAAASDGRSRRHHRGSQDPGRRPDHDRQFPDPTRRHRCAIGRPVMPQSYRRALDLRGRRARRTDPSRRQKSWTCHVLRTDPRGRNVAHCEVDGEDIQKWLVSSGWALSYARFSHDYDADEKTAREAKAGMWQGAFIAPWDWRVRNKKTVILGATKPPPNAHAILLASASGPVAPSPDCTIKGNVNWRRRMHLSHAHQPLVCADQDADQQGHPLVLLGRGGRSGRLPRDPALRCFSCARARVKRFSKSRAARYRVTALQHRLRNNQGNQQ